MKQVLSHRATLKSQGNDKRPCKPGCRDCKIYDLLKQISKRSTNTAEVKEANTHLEYVRRLVAMLKAKALDVDKDEDAADLYFHAQGCRDQPCGFASSSHGQCKSAKALLSHFSSCTRTDCPICTKIDDRYKRVVSKARINAEIREIREEMWMSKKDLQALMLRENGHKTILESFGGKCDSSILTFANIFFFNQSFHLSPCSIFLTMLFNLSILLHAPYS